MLSSGQQIVSQTVVVYGFEHRELPSSSGQRSQNLTPVR
jgi:hypothetical protein